MKRLNKLLTVFLSTIMIVAMISGCSSSSSTSAGDVTSTSDVVDKEATFNASGENSETDAEIRIGANYNMTNLSPLRTTSDHLYTYSIPLYERLMYLNADGKYVPWLLKSFTAGEDGVSYEFVIYDNIYDSAGNHITADDIVYDIEKNIENNMKPDFGKVKSVEKVDEFTIKMELTQDMVYLFESIMWNTNVFSKAAFEASDDNMNTTAVSTSAYEVTEFVTDSTLVYERRDNHWQSDKSLIPDGMQANTKKFTFLYIPEASQRIIALETNVVDMVLDIDASTALPYLENEQFDYEVKDDKEGNTLFFSGHDSRAVANDVYLRQAICYALDNEAFVQGVCYGQGEAMQAPYVNSGMGYNAEWDSEGYYSYDPEKAKEMLALSNYNGEELEFLTLSMMQREAEIIQSYCEAVGINVKINIVDYALISQLRLDGSAYDLFLWRINTTSLAYNWSIRYDCNAYSSGDATSRHDTVLADMLYKTWTNNGYTQENIDEVHHYIMDNAYAYGLFKRYSFTFINTDVGLTNAVSTYYGFPAQWACTFVQE